jgi:hypothetical protein
MRIQSGDASLAERLAQPGIEIRREIDKLRGPRRNAVMAGNRLTSLEFSQELDKAGGFT